MKKRVPYVDVPDDNLILLHNVKRVLDVARESEEALQRKSASSRLRIRPRGFLRWGLIKSAA